MMGAKLEVWSEVDAGTEVELRVSAGTAYTSAGRNLPGCQECLPENLKTQMETVHERRGLRQFEFSRLTIIRLCAKESPAWLGSSRT